MSFINRLRSSVPSILVAAMSDGSVGMRWIKSCSTFWVMTPMVTNRSPRRPPSSACSPTALTTCSVVTSLASISRSPNRIRALITSSNRDPAQGTRRLPGPSSRQPKTAFPTSYQVLPGYRQASERVRIEGGNTGRVYDKSVLVPEDQKQAQDHENRLRKEAKALSFQWMPRAAYESCPS